MSIQFNKIKLIDSHNFIPMALSKFPATFCFQEMKKGFFPHALNTPENQNKIFSTFPDKKYYTPKFMSTSQHAEFIECDESLSVCSKNLQISDWRS